MVAHITKTASGSSYWGNIVIVSVNYNCLLKTRSIRKMLGPFATVSRIMPIHQVSLAVLSCAACISMFTTTTTMTTTTTSTTTTMRNEGDRYGPMEWAQKINIQCQDFHKKAYRQGGLRYILSRTNYCSFTIYL